MNNHLTTTRALRPCPPWCVDDVNDPGQGDHHFGELYTHLDTGAQMQQTLCVRLALFTERGEPDILYISVASRIDGEQWDDGVHPDNPLSPSGAAWLGATLLMVAAQAIPAQRASSPPEILPEPMDQWGKGVGTFICVCCGSEVHPDSTPDLDRCWICSELADVAAGIES